MIIEKDYYMLDKKEVPRFYGVAFYKYSPKGLVCVLPIPINLVVRLTVVIGKKGKNFYNKTRNIISRFRWIIKQIWDWVKYGEKIEIKIKTKKRLIN